MLRRISIALLCLPLLGFGIIPISGRRDAAPPAGNIEDDFSGDLSKWTELTGSWSIVSEEVTTTNSGVLIYTDEQTSTVSQWAQVELVGITAFYGLYMRSTNNASEYAYAFRRDSNDRIMWRYCQGHGCTTIVQGTTSVADGNCLGVEITGTGDSTVVEIWDLGSTCPVDHSTWGTSDETFTDDPANAADTGKYTGVYYGASQDATMDNFAAGDI